MQKQKKKNLENQKREKPQSETTSSRRSRKNGTEIIKEKKNMMKIPNLRDGSLRYHVSTFRTL